MRRDPAPRSTRGAHLSPSVLNCAGAPKATGAARGNVTTSLYRGDAPATMQVDKFEVELP